MYMQRYANTENIRDFEIQLKNSTKNIIIKMQHLKKIYSRSFYAFEVYIAPDAIIFHFFLNMGQ